MVVDRPDWCQVTTPSAREPWHNIVLRASLTDAEADSRIAETIEHYRAHGLTFLWTVSESSRPRDLGERLLRAGMSLRSEAHGMVLEVDALPPTSSLGEVTTESVHLANVEDYVDAAVAAWNSSQHRASMLEDMLRILRRQKADVQYFIARRHGIAVGTAFLRVVETPAAVVGYLAGGSVHPDHRGRGVYRALLGARAAWLRERAIPLMTIAAFPETAAPICRRLGFRHVTSERSYQWIA